MSSLNFIGLMKLYSRRGIADWRNAEDELRIRAQTCLGTTAIAENENEVDETLETFYDGKNADQLKFIPMPEHRKTEVERCFFIPIRGRTAGGNETVAFDLFLIVAKTDCLAFRFEPAHASTSPHGYGHVQLSKKLLKRTREAKGIPSWLPDSYPAFPISTADPLRIFLCMTTAVHGYQGGLVTLLQDILQKAGYASHLDSYLKELEKMLT